MRSFTWAGTSTRQPPSSGVDPFLLVLEVLLAPTGIDIFKVVEKGSTPVIDAGVAGKDGGQIGAGVVRPPMDSFEAAVAAYQERYGRTSG